MTLYISCINGYHFGIQQGKWRPMEIDGELRMVARVPELVAHFGGKILPHAARLAALEHFDQRHGSSNGDPPGPFRTDGVSNDPDFMDFAYEGSDHYMQFTAFDTETDISEETYEEAEACGMTREEVRALYERKLDASQERGGSYIKVETLRLAAPWPKYDSIRTAEGVQTAAVAKRIRETVETLGLDPELVAAYERENLSREYVLFALGELSERQAEKAAEDAALSVP